MSSGSLVAVFVLHTERLVRGDVDAGVLGVVRAVRLAEYLSGVRTEDVLKASDTTAKKVYSTNDMSGPAPALAQKPGDLSGTWSFTHFDDRFQGRITLRQSGSTLEGTWHTSSGKSEPDTLVTGSVDGTAVTLTRFLGSNQQSYALTLSADGNRLDGFGEGYFLHHTNRNMTRNGDGKAATARTRDHEPVGSGPLAM
jgi:hypothetical protein